MKNINKNVQQKSEEKDIMAEIEKGKQDIQETAGKILEQWKEIRKATS